jgi:peptidoglycan/xylan/chitin deacetylase (PgdA/CDA1 family)
MRLARTVVAVLLLIVTAANAQTVTVTSETNAFANADFEAGGANWAFDPDGAKIDAAAAKSGQGGLRIFTTEPTPTGASANSMRFPVEPGQEVRLSFAARSKAKIGAAYLFFYDEKQKPVATPEKKGGYIAPISHGDGQWHDYSVTAVAPAGAKLVGVFVKTWSNTVGEIDFDDFALAGIKAGSVGVMPPAARAKPKVRNYTVEELPVRTKPLIVVLKLDDVKQVKGDVHNQWKKTADFLASRNVKSGFGVICETLPEATPAYANWFKKHAEGGLIEFWFHAWDHASHDVGSAKHNEMSGRTYEDLAKRLADSQAAAKEKLGFTFKTFGPPGGSGTSTQDEVTGRVMQDSPDITVWLYPSPIDKMGQEIAAKGKVTILDRVWAANLEAAVGSPSLQYLINGIATNPDREYFILQGHPGAWGGAKFDEFIKIIDFLQSQNAVFMTPSELAAKLKNE